MVWLGKREIEGFIYWLYSLSMKLTVCICRVTMVLNVMIGERSRLERVGSACLIYVCLS